MRALCSKICAGALLATLLCTTVANAQPAATAGFPVALVEADPAWLSTPLDSDNTAWHEHFAAWSRAGVDGFLVPWPGPPAASTQGPPETVGDAARAAGLDTWFALVTLPADLSFLSNGNAARAVLDTLAEDVRDAAATGYQGVALAADPAAPGYSVLWEGHQPGTGRPDTLFRSVRQLGAEVGRIVSGEQGGGDVLLITGDLSSARPLWYPFLSGVIEGSESRARGVHAIISPTQPPGDPAGVERLLRDHRERLAAALDGRARTVWDRVGSVGMRSVYPGADAAPDAILRWFAARLHADRILVATVPTRALTPIPPPTPEPPSLLFGEAEPPKQPPRPLIEALDGFTRLAPWPNPDTPGYVLHHERGTAVLFWTGYPAVIRAEGMVTALPVTDLLTNVRVFVEPVDSVTETGPHNGPVLVERLPAREWAMPACLWIEADPMQPDGGLPVRFGLLNPGPLAISGTLAAQGPRQTAVSPASLPVELGPGEAQMATGMMRGEIVPGRPVAVDLTLVTREGGTVARTEIIIPEPPALWGNRLHGPVTGLAAVVHEDRELIVAVTASGDAAAYDPSGAEVWRTWFPHAITGSPALFRHWTGEPRLALSEMGGKIHTLTTGGDDRGVFAANEITLQGPPQPARLSRFPGDELMITHADGSVHAVLSNGQPLWTHESETATAGCTPADADGNGYHEVFVAGETLTCLDRHGDWRWRTPLPGGASCPPLAADLHGDGTTMVLTGTHNGFVQSRDAQWGLVEEEAAVGGPVLHLAAADLDPSPGLEVLAATARALHMLSADLAPLREVPVACGPVPPLVVPGPGTPRIAIPGADGLLTLISADGNTLWTRRHAFTITAATLRYLENSTPAAIVGCADGTLAAIPLNIP
jgi:hypothetical protein